ncbi:MAG: DUF3438 family protein [Gammaproteobacteria bacterium]|nr:DUF3438 family protein [Gammaproteobacteria bacterium]
MGLGARLPGRRAAGDRDRGGGIVVRRTGVVLCVVCAAVASAQTVEWERTPIAVTLAVGVERQVRFEGPATVGVPAGLLETGALRAEFANDTAYWLATEPFGKRRFKVRLERTGEFVLFDVTAVPGAGGAGETLEVVVARPEQGGASSAPNADDLRGDLVELVRHAARLDLAPPRLAAPPAGTVPVETAATDVTALYCGADPARLRLAVVGQLARAGLFVTTFEASNLTGAPLELDVRRLRPEAGPRTGTAGGIVAVGWTRSTLAAAGEAGFTARFYVVTRAPFDLAADSR